MSSDTEIARWNGERPQVKLIADKLFTKLGAGLGSYGETLFAEYGHPGQVWGQQDLGWGVLVSITFPANPERPEWTTHLIFGGCVEAQVREYLVSIGLGGVQITQVYAPGEPVHIGGDSPADYPDEL